MFNVLRSVGVFESFRCVFSYIWISYPPAQGPHHVRGLDCFALRLAAVRMFFKTYTEKVWGVPATEIQADWGRAAHQEPVVHQRGRERNPAEAQQKDITSLIEEFQYPSSGRE